MSYLDYSPSLPNESSRLLNQKIGRQSKYLTNNPIQKIELINSPKGTVTVGLNPSEKQVGQPTTKPASKTQTIFNNSNLLRPKKRIKSKEELELQVSHSKKGMIAGISRTFNTAAALKSDKMMQRIFQ